MFLLLPLFTIMRTVHPALFLPAARFCFLTPLVFFLFCPHCNSFCNVIFVILYRGFDYKIPKTRHCGDGLINKVFFLGEAFGSPVFGFTFSPLSLIFSPFLGCQTPSKDDNSEDEQLKPFFLGVEGYWAGDRRQLRVFPCFNGGIFYHLWFQLNVGFNPFGCFE